MRTLVRSHANLAFLLKDELESKAQPNMAQEIQYQSSLDGLEGSVHVEVHALGGHCGCAVACSRGDGIFVAY